MDARFYWTYCPESATAQDRSLVCSLPQRSPNRCQRCWLSVLSDYDDSYLLHRMGAVDLQTHCRLFSNRKRKHLPQPQRTRKGPVYLGSSEGCCLSTRTSTSFVIQRSCGTRERNFSFPCQGFSLNVCAAIADANSLPKAEASSMFTRETTNWPGSAGCWPVTNMDGDTPMSRFAAARYPSITHGSSASQFALPRRRARSEFFRQRCIRSTLPLCCGW